MRTEQAVIYVAGNPELYPLEYYDRESGSYQGAIPDFLARFAGEYGYDLRYLEPGAADRREGFAENLQVDLISGCREGERYANTAGEPLLLFSAREDGGEAAYQLRFTRVAPAGFQAELREFAARTSHGEWTGAVLEAAGEAPPARFPLPAVLGAGLALALLLAALLVVLRRLRRERRRAEEALLTDPETGLGTTAALERSFSHLKRDQSRKFYHLICFRLDLGHIGLLWGQEAARALLLHGARVLREEAGPADLLIRSGDGLLALRRSPDSGDALDWARAAAEKLRAFPPAGGALSARDVSAGVCPLDMEYQSLEQALFHAEQCALRAGMEESDCRLCGTEQCAACRERWKLLADFPQAVERGDFQLYLQFFVDARTFRVVGGEALSRWHHPRLGFLRPDRYIPLLEEAGRIGALDFHGMEQACAFLEALDRRNIRDFFLSCNFSRRTFSAPDFARRCIGVMERYSFPRKLLILEVTETQRLDRREGAQMLRNIQDIRDYGARVIFDDFGMGFSSFHDLQDFPMDGLKLDKELVDNMWTERGRIILHALVRTGHRMGLTILAEGVEEDRQIQTLQQLGCDVLQGFRFCVPLPAEEARRRILEEFRPGAGSENGREMTV